MIVTKVFSRVQEKALASTALLNGLPRDVRGAVVVVMVSAGAGDCAASGAGDVRVIAVTCVRCVAGLSVVRAWLCDCGTRLGRVVRGIVDVWVVILSARLKQTRAACMD
jgi:hypothetical protein